MFFRNSLDVTPTAGDFDIPSDSPVKVFRIGVAGDVVVQLGKDAENTPQTFKNVQAGEILEIRAKKIIQAGTTAQNIIALW